MVERGRDFTADDAWAFNGGTHTSAYDVLGAHPTDEGVVFRVWAPNAAAVTSNQRSLSPCFFENEDRRI